MVKFLLLLVIAGGIFLLTPSGQHFATAAIDVVNPASNERQTLTTLKQQLDTIAKTAKEPGAPAQLESLVSQASTTLGQAQDDASKIDVGATVSNLVAKVLPASWTGNSCQSN